MYRLTSCMNCFTYSKENSKSGNLKDLKREGLLTSERLVIRGNQNKHNTHFAKHPATFNVIVPLPLH